VPLAARLAGAGKRVVLIERSRLGGTCVNYGCTPTKTMVASARAAHVARGAARLGVRTGNVRVDLAAVVDRKGSIVAQWRAGVERHIAAAGERLQLVRGHARFVDGSMIEVEGERDTAGTIVINTGARPAVPPIEGLDRVPWLDNRNIMHLKNLPPHLLILGGGYIACEFGQMFRRFGSEVTMLLRGEHLLSREDPEISTAIEEVFRGEGITIRPRAGVTRIEQQGDSLVARLKEGAPVRGSQLLVAVGRVPNSDDLGCEAAGIERDARGVIVVDEQYRTSAAGIYAVGDVTGGPQFTHTAWDDHRIVFDILMGQAARSRSNRVIPYAVFTDPQVARVGLSERQAAESGVEYEAATMPFGQVARAIELDETAGVMKVLLDPATERILGAAIVGLEAGELIHIFVPLMQAGAPARAIVEAQHAHPTLAEGVQALVMRLSRYAPS
jgi:pyruvate/2-oxoglutarate dehydrogenase complex dihydrolipoamide dehydrogenase (E3) component